MIISERRQRSKRKYATTLDLIENIHWFRCSADKPVPPASYGLELDYTRSYFANQWNKADTEEVRQGGKIYYKCKDPKHGIAYNFTGLEESGQWEGSKVSGGSRIVGH